MEIVRHLIGKSQCLYFSELERSDSLELRKRILELTARQARELGISKSTLHYLRRNAKSDRVFRVYRKVRDKLESAQTI